MPTATLVDTRHQYDQLFSIYVPIAIGVFIVVVATIAFAVLRYSRLPPSAAARWHENNRLEGGYALVLVAVVAFLLYVTYSAEHQTDTVSAEERPAVTVDVTGSKWEWRFRYPAYGITRLSGTVGRQQVVVPTNEAVRFELSSADVIHAFWVPELRFKRDLIPGATESITLDFPHAGTYTGQCAEFCGLRHADMLFTIRAVAPPQFAAWTRRTGKAPPP